MSWCTCTLEVYVTYPRIWLQYKMMTPSNGNIFRVTGHLCGESPHKGQWRGALVFSLFFAWINSWISNREVGDLRRHHTQYDVTVMKSIPPPCDYAFRSTLHGTDSFCLYGLLRALGVALRIFVWGFLVEEILDAVCLGNNTWMVGQRSPPVMDSILKSDTLNANCCILTECWNISCQESIWRYIIKEIVCIKNVSN